MLGANGGIPNIRGWQMGGQKPPLARIISSREKI